MTAAERVAEAYARLDAADRPEVWIALRDRPEALAAARAVDARVAGGEPLPLAGRTLAVKDNIDVAGLDTTAGCPAYAYRPARSAPVVQRLEAAGAVVLGKTNLDQFATGLTGTRSPYGAVRDARRPAYVSGGSSSGSAVAVAIGIADLALGTDTAGSGRVPAAFGGIVGIKPTRGLVPAAGVVPACRTFDCVTVFAHSVGEAQAAVTVMAGPDDGDPQSRGWPPTAPLGAPPRPCVAVPSAGGLGPLTAAARDAFAGAAARLADAGAELVEIDLEPFLETGRMLYDGAFVAERHAAVGAFIDAHRDEVDPTAGAIIAAAGAIPAPALVADGERLDVARRAFAASLAGIDALLVPTTTAQPTIERVAADPVGVNARLGVYTAACNLLDLCAVAVPGGEADGGCFGVTLMAPAFGDLVAGDLARLLLGEPLAAPPAGAGIDLLVVGAHLSGMPLNGQLVERGGRLVAETRTAPAYRLYALATTPPKPGLVRQADGGAPIAGELWRLPASGLASLLEQLPPPMALGRVTIESGDTVVGFLCEPAAVDGAADITAHGGWRAYAGA
jgi:allophanate hydrolase